PSTPELPVTYFGAMRAGLVYVPLDLRMSKAAIEGIVQASGARLLIRGTGHDAPDPAEFGLGDFPSIPVERIGASILDDEGTLPAGWDREVDAWSRPTPEDLVQLIFTSGTTGTPKGVMLAHDNLMAANRSFHNIVPPMKHRIVSLLPLSHLLEQAVGVFYAISVGASVLYVRSRNPRVIFDALREHRVTSMVVVPQVLDLFWSAIVREVEKSGRTKAFDRLRSIARRLPASIRRLIFRRVHVQLGGDFRLFVS